MNNNLKKIREWVNNIRGEIREWFRLQLFSIALRLLKHTGYVYGDIKKDKSGEFVEAFTFSNNEEYINKVSEIE